MLYCEGSKTNLSEGGKVSCNEGMGIGRFAKKHIGDACAGGQSYKTER